MLKDNEIKKVKFFDADRWIVGALTVDSSTTYVDNSDKLMEQVESLYSSMMHLEKLVVHMYNSDNKDMCKDELVIQKFKITKSDLQQRNEKYVRDNGVLQASLDKRKQVLHKWCLDLEQDVSSLQE